MKRRRTHESTRLQMIPWCHLWPFLDDKSHVNLSLTSQNPVIRTLFVQSKRWQFPHVPLLAKKVSVPCCVTTNDMRKLPPTTKDVMFHSCGNYSCKPSELLIVPEGVVKFNSWSIDPDRQEFNQNREFRFPASLTELNVSEDFDKPVILPPNLIRVTFGCMFNQELTLPSKLQSLRLKNNFDKPLTLPDSLTELYIGMRFNKPLELTSNLTLLHLEHCFNQHLDLPLSLTDLQLSMNFDKPLKLPPNLTRLYLGVQFNEPVNIPLSMTDLTLSCQFNQPLDLPSNLTHLDIGNRFNQPLVLPNGLRRLQIGFDFNRPLILPESLEGLWIRRCGGGYGFLEQLCIPRGLQYFEADRVIRKNLTHYFSHFYPGQF